MVIQGNLRADAGLKIRTRAPVAGPELELVEAALQSGLTIARTQPVVFREPALPNGFPDIVAVFLARRGLLLTPERLALRGDHFRLLHHLHLTGSATIEALSATVVWGERTIEMGARYASS